MNGVVSGINPADSFTRISPIGQAAYHFEEEFPIKDRGMSGVFCQPSSRMIGPDETGPAF
ncbi:hypothetical protein DVQ84_07160 [Yersinia enterocolitica]|uniref:Uncharacterized protein n=2 Tax=Yersinia enterocolitica TaxID=630 RepID=A0A0H3NPV0_YERE1|nr:hypothetical protein [Yersinia enterocolitica]QBP98716.1 hypothetical protein YEY1_07870 [Yersinia enterocolitica subsp. palearctica]CBX71721.1 unknown protein [Yersinia enterocolitica W22703]CBY27144.1 hypothetical protein Y11_10371 [Yersinia enterocolitica subsp. palearctica Y11]CCO68720.1 hypothetical protein D322_1846 [Yersinia enterocolitica IP 10393]